MEHLTLPHIPKNKAKIQKKNVLSILFKYLQHVQYNLISPCKAFLSTYDLHNVSNVSSYRASSIALTCLGQAQVPEADHQLKCGGQQLWQRQPAEHAGLCPTVSQ